MIKYFKYFKYLMIHKINVFKECWKARLYLHAFTHDLSKFSPSEFITYAKYFYGDKEKYKEQFDLAWEHHFMNNKHHWNYWCYDHEYYWNTLSKVEDCKLGKPNDMPFKYLEQMICDWKAMSNVFGDTAQSFYLKNYSKIELSDKSRIELESLLDLNDSSEVNYGHTLKQFVDMYDERQFNQIFGFIKEMYYIDVYNLLRGDKNDEI